MFKKVFYGSCKWSAVIACWIPLLSIVIGLVVFVSLAGVSMESLSGTVSQPEFDWNLYFSSFKAIIFRYPWALLSLLGPPASWFLVKNL